jgi:hypothetical protein
MMQRVLFARHRLKVIWVAAQRGMARMVQTVTVNCPALLFVKRTVCGHLRCVPEHRAPRAHVYSVSILHGALPNPAS